MAQFTKMNTDETRIVNQIYVDIQGLLACYPENVNVQHALTAMTLTMIGQATIAKLSREYVAEEFAKISCSILEGDYDDFIERTILGFEKPPTDTVQ